MAALGDDDRTAGQRHHHHYRRFECKEVGVSGVVDVGEALELTFHGSAGQVVTASWLDPGQITVIDAEVVPESSTVAGDYPQIFVPTAAGMWTAVFYSPGQPETYYVRARALLGPLPFAAVGDVAAQFGTLTTAQEGLTAHLVRAGSDLLRLRARQAGQDVDVDLAAGRITAEMAALTVANMVLRVLRNPKGLRSETVGPFSRTFDTTAAAGLLVVTDYDLAAITPAAVVPDGIGALGIGTIRVVPGLAPPVHRHRGGWSGHGWY
jgi:hypothetical protein